jgi:hypothetical protein
MMQTPKRDWVTLSEAAQIAGRRTGSLLAAVQRHRILAEKSSNTWLIYLPALMDYLKYTDQVRAAGNPNAAKKIGGPFCFLGHGKKVKYTRRMQYDPRWWENLHEWEIITENPGE